MLEGVRVLTMMMMGVDHPDPHLSLHISSKICSRRNFSNG